MTDMDNGELVTYVSHLIDAYTSISRRMEKLEHEIQILRSEREEKTVGGCKIYRMQIRKKAADKSV